MTYWTFMLASLQCPDSWKTRAFENKTSPPENGVDFNTFCLCSCVMSVFSSLCVWPGCSPSVPAALSPQVAPSATESCFARQHNVSDNNNQCFSGANGHLPSQLAAQRPGAIDNQPLVNTDPMKARTCVCVCACDCCSIYFVYEQYKVNWIACVVCVEVQSEADCPAQTVQLIYNIYSRKNISNTGLIWSWLHLSLM